MSITAIRAVQGLLSLALAFCLACGGSTGENTDDPNNPGDPNNPTGPTGPSSSCEGKALPGLAPDHLLIGAKSVDGLETQAGFDIEYQYICAGIPQGDGPCASCALGCSTRDWDDTVGDYVTHGCADYSCVWWGCWQDIQDPPGTQYGSDFAGSAAGRSRFAMFTYYQLLQSYRQVDHNLAEGTDQVTIAAQNVAFMRRYLADFQFLLRRIGSNPAIVHIEPDFWGYAEHAASAAGHNDPTRLGAAVASANSSDCAGLPDTIAGLGKCMIAMVRKYAPNAKVGLHSSAWASGIDVDLNDDSSLDVAGEGKKVGDFLKACGADDADVVVADIADRDAADNGHWLNTTETLPSILQALQFQKAVAEAVGRPILWWQVPVGNMSLNDTQNSYRDNRLDYFLDYPGVLAEYGAIGAAFGGGQWSSTNPDSDGGHLYERAAAYANAGGQKLCQ